MMAAGISGSLHDILHEAVPQTHRVEVHPHRFIVAWHGVLTLCFEAWPKPLAQLKRRINDMPEFCQLPENFGTRWPKLTIAALHDDAPPLTIDQLGDLTALCREFEAELQKLDAVPLMHCLIVMFASRSLNHCLCRVDYAFNNEDSSSNQNKQEYDADFYEIVQEVIKETEHLDEYLSKVNAKGHRWGEHYHTTWTETTLACFSTNDNKDESSSSSSPYSLLALLTLFQDSVDALLPGSYAWMPQKSLHLSLRTLENRSNLQRDKK